MNPLDTMHYATELSKNFPEYSGWTSSAPMYRGVFTPNAVYGQMLLAERRFDCYLTQGFSPKSGLSLSLRIRIFNDWQDQASIANEMNTEVYESFDGCVALVGGDRPSPAGYFVTSCKQGDSGISGTKLTIMHILACIVVPKLADLHAEGGSASFNSDVAPFHVILKAIADISESTLARLLD